MNTPNLRKLLVPLALFAFLAIGQIKASDTGTDSTPNTTTTTPGDSGATPDQGDPNGADNTLPITLAQFDALRGLIQRQSDNAAQLDKDFQAFLDDLLGTPAPATP